MKIFHSDALLLICISLMYGAQASEEGACYPDTAECYFHMETDAAKKSALEAMHEYRKQQGLPPPKKGDRDHDILTKDPTLIEHRYVYYCNAQRRYEVKEFCGEMPCYVLSHGWPAQVAWATCSTLPGMKYRKAKRSVEAKKKKTLDPSRHDAEGWTREVGKKDEDRKDDERKEDNDRNEGKDRKKKERKDERH